MSVEALVGILAAAVVILMALAVLLTAARRAQGLRKNRFLGRLIGADSEADRQETEPDGKRPTAWLPERGGRPVSRADAVARRRVRPPDDRLEEVLRSSFSVNSFDRAVRVLTWSFILIVLAIVTMGELWRPVQEQIFATLLLAGFFVLAVHELIPPENLPAARIVLEASAAIAILTMLVLLTGGVASPFFFLYALVVGGAALMAPPAVAVVLIIETLAAYAITATYGPLDAANAGDTLGRIGINLTALGLLAYLGAVVARIQRHTRDAAIRLSTIDSMTDLFNRAFLFSAVDREIERGRRFQRGFCLLMMDLDGLKSINDRYGHYYGDIVLRGVARVIKANLRGIDIAARYGGDEFVALLPETDPTGAWVVAEKIRRVTSELTLEANGERIATSLSIGVVSSPEDGTTADELMIAADEAMYSSKRLGKNRVVAYSKADHFELPTRHRRRHTTQGLRPLPSEGEGEGESEGDGEGPGEGDGEGPGDGKGPGEGRLVEREQRS